MNFESLANFDWYNEPENVRFETDNMVIYAKPQTDFWQSVQHGFKKDNGHFFFSRKDGDFSFIVRWRFDRLDKFAQCGVMLRTDERNWLKASLMNETEDENLFFLLSIRNLELFRAGNANFETADHAHPFAESARFYSSRPNEEIKRILGKCSCFWYHPRDKRSEQHGKSYQCPI